MTNTLAPNPIELPDVHQFSINFDSDLLQADLNRIETDSWIAHVNTRAYNGGWDVFPLRCSAEHLDAHPILQSFAIEMVNNWHNLPVLEQCPGLHAVLQMLESHQIKVYSMRLMRLHAGAEITEHRDQGVGLEHGEIRLHVPIQTNTLVEFKVNGKQAIMQPGELWYINADQPHSVTNRGNTDRIHLVIDMAVNDWLRSQLGIC